MFMHVLTLVGTQSDMAWLKAKNYIRWGEAGISSSVPFALGQPPTNYESLSPTNPTNFLDQAAGITKLNKCWCVAMFDYIETMAKQEWMNCYQVNGNSKISTVLRSPNIKCNSM